MNESRRTILVVEDDEHMLEGIRDVLEIAGYEVIPAVDGMQALARMEQLQPDLIVADIMMPRMDGYELLSAVRANPKWLRIPFIFLTAKDQRIDVRFGKRLGAEDYLTKPFEPADLLVAVGAKVERAAALQASAEAEMSQVKQNILRSLSHEFRTPLTYIRGYLDLILEEGLDRLSTDEAYEFLRGMKRGSDRLSRLVDDFIFLVMLETGEAAANFWSDRIYFTGLRSLLEIVVQQKTPLARKRRVSLHLDIPDPLPSVVLHVGFFRDALERLIDNAIKFSPEEQGAVLVTAKAIDTWVFIAVQDNGIGISDEEMPNLFKSMHQIDREELEQSGVGVGLAIAKAIVELHDGRIEVESQVGQGSTFTLVLPVADVAPDVDQY